MALEEIAYFPILGRPLLVWLGLSTIIFVILTAITGYFIFRGRLKINITWHFRLAYISIALAATHGILAMATGL
jgi:RsiW-degrading membrane proteinase PrsW (M82 family)